MKWQGGYISSNDPRINFEDVYTTTRVSISKKVHASVIEKVLFTNKNSISKSYFFSKLRWQNYLPTFDFD